MVTHQARIEKPDFAGELIGRGGNRIVFAHLHDPGVVVKVPVSADHACVNIDEWHGCIYLHGAGLAKWIAPCVDIARDGSWLIMKKTRPISGHLERNQVPEQLQHDMKSTNWGVLRDRLVCHDYQHVCARYTPYGMHRMAPYPDGTPRAYPYPSREAKG